MWDSRMGPWTGVGMPPASGGSGASGGGSPGTGLGSLTTEDHVFATGANSTPIGQRRGTITGPVRGSISGRSWAQSLLGGGSGPSAAAAGPALTGASQSGQGGDPGSDEGSPTAFDRAVARAVEEYLENALRSPAPTPGPEPRPAEEVLGRAGTLTAPLHASSLGSSAAAATVAGGVFSTSLPWGLGSAFPGIGGRGVTAAPYGAGVTGPGQVPPAMVASTAPAPEVPVGPWRYGVPQLTAGIPVPPTHNPPAVTAVSLGGWAANPEVTRQGWRTAAAPQGGVPFPGPPPLRTQAPRGAFQSGVVHPSWAAATWPPAPRGLDTKLAKFSGDRDTASAELWLRNLGRAAQIHGWDAAHALWMACSNLTGLAAVWLTGLEDEFFNHPGGPGQGWQSFWNAFCERFVVANEQLLRKQYEDRVQRSEETVAEYADSLRSAAMKLGLHIDGTDVREKFMKGLWERQIKVKLETVAKLIPATYKGLVEWAADFEVRTGREKERSNPAKPSAPASFDRGGNSSSPGGSSNQKAPSVPDEVKQLMDNVTELNKQLNLQSQVLARIGKDQNAARQQGLKCYNCGAAGHLRANCPKPPRPRPPLPRVNVVTGVEGEDLALPEDEYYLEDVLQQMNALDTLLLEEEEAGGFLGANMVFLLEPEDDPLEAGTVDDLTLASPQLEVAFSQAACSKPLDRSKTRVKLDSQGRVLRIIPAAVAPSTPAAKTGTGGPPQLDGLLQTARGRDFLRQLLHTAEAPPAPSGISPAGPGVPRIPQGRPPPGPGSLSCYVKGTIVGMSLECLLDTGASQSIIPQATIQALRLGSLVRFSGREFVTANGDVAAPAGEVEALRIKLGEDEFTLKCLVVKRACYKMLLGLDLILPVLGDVLFSRSVFEFDTTVPGQTGRKQVPLWWRRERKTLSDIWVNARLGDRFRDKWGWG